MQQINFPAFTSWFEIWCTENPIPQPYNRVLILRTPKARYEVYSYDEKFFYIQYPSGQPSTPDILPPSIMGTYLPSCNTIRQLLSHITAVNEEKLEVGIWGPYPLQDAWSDLTTVDALDADIGSDLAFYMHTEEIPCLLFTVPEDASPWTTCNFVPLNKDLASLNEWKVFTPDYRPCLRHLTWCMRCNATNCLPTCAARESEDDRQECTCHTDSSPFPIIDEALPADATLANTPPPRPLQHEGAQEALEKQAWRLMGECKNGECIFLSYQVTHLGCAMTYLERRGNQFVRKHFEGTIAAFNALQFTRMHTASRPKRI